MEFAYPDGRSAHKEGDIVIMAVAGCLGLAEDYSQCAQDVAVKIKLGASIPLAAQELRTIADWLESRDWTPEFTHQLSYYQAHGVGLKTRYSVLTEGPLDPQLSGLTLYEAWEAGCRLPPGTPWRLFRELPWLKNVARTLVAAPPTDGMYHNPFVED